MDVVSRQLAALADPTRRAILERLASGERTMTELAAPFDMTLPAITKHVRILRDAGLISQSRQAQYRPCKLEAGALRPVEEWLHNHRATWENRLDRLDAFLKESAPLRD